MLSRRQFVAHSVSLGAAAGLPLAASAQAAFPTKPIRLVVPFGAGGVADLTARTVAQKMSESLGQSIVIDNKPGAGGVVAADTVAKAAADGYTLFLMSNGTAVSEGLFKKLPFDSRKDFAPVSMLGFFDLVIVAPEGSRFKTLAELVAFAKANPGKLNIGTVAIGSTQNLAAELFKTSAGIDAQIVPFNGTPAVVTALRGGQVDVAVEILPPVAAQITAKALRALAVMGDHHAPTLPGVPTVKEAAGLAQFSVASWNALAAPARTPRDVVARLNQEVQAAVKSPEVRKRLAELGVEARGSTPEQQATLLDAEIKRWSEVITRAGIPRQ